MKKITFRNILIGIYILVVLGISAISKASDYTILPFPNNAHVSHYQGYVTQDVDGRFFLIVDQENQYYFELVSNKDLSALNGWQVKVDGIEQLMYKVGPIVSTQSLNPIDDDRDKSVTIPKLQVISINGIAPLEQ